MLKLFALPGSLLLVALLAAPAAADSVGLSVGESVVFQSAARQVGGTTQLNLGASFDLGPTKPLPVRASLVFDYAGGSANGGSLSNYGGGLGVRLTTPIYAGVNGLFYNVSLSPGGGLASANRTGFGTNYFVGERLASLPGGASVSLQATYRQLPTVNGVDPSGLGVSLRLGF
jgi:hypothetical protein